MPKKKLDPVHPGEILREEFPALMGLSQNRLAGRLQKDRIRVGFDQGTRNERELSPAVDFRP